MDKMKARQLLKLFFVLALLLPATQPAALSQDGITEVFNKVLKKYSGVKSVTFSFQSVEKPDYKGMIKAKLGNKYIIETGSRTITCNGKTIWNYTPGNKKVVVSSYEEASSDELSIEKVFFNFLDGYKAVSVTKATSSVGPAAYTIVLQPKAKPTIISTINLTKVTIKVSRNDYTLLSLSVDDNGTVQTWTVRNIKLNNKLDNGIFNFTAPTGTSVVDLR